MPISAQTTIGIKDRVPKSLAPWHDGPSLLEYLDDMQTLERKVNAPFMMPINGKYRVSVVPARRQLSPTDACSRTWARWSRARSSRA